MHQSFLPSSFRVAAGRFGALWRSQRAETLMAALVELDQAYEAAQKRCGVSG